MHIVVSLSIVHHSCAHTHLIDSVLNDALRIVTRWLRPTPTDHLPILSGIHPAELGRLGPTLFIAYRASLDLDHILHGLLSGFSDARRKKLRSKRPFVPAARKLLNKLALLGIRASQWANYRRNTEYCESASRLRAFIPIASSGPVGLVCSEQLGLSSIVCGQVLGDSIYPCTNEVSLLHRIAGVAPLKKSQTTS